MFQRMSTIIKNGTDCVRQRYPPSTIEKRLLSPSGIPQFHSCADHEPPAPCPLLQHLPLELRLMIYRLILNDRHFQVTFPHPRKSVHSNDQWSDGAVTWWWNCAQESPRHELVHHVDLGWSAVFLRNDATGLMFACKQM